MTQESLEIWQEALQRCDTWKESISNTRKTVESQHGDNNQLLSRAEITWPEASRGVSLEPIMNAEAEVLWNLYGRVRKSAGSDNIAWRSAYPY